jgi:hypothetical protein
MPFCSAFSLMWLRMFRRISGVSMGSRFLVVQTRCIQIFKYPILREDFWLKPCIYAFVLTPGLKSGVILYFFLYRKYPEKNTCFNQPSPT